jgi:predicted ATP-grasp superfamily ATP-dependent carboligase
MHILVYEYLTGGGHNGNPCASLIEEGERMVMALVRDLLHLPEHTVTLIRDARLNPCPFDDHRLKLLWVQPHEDPEVLLSRSLVNVDAVWPIAPETGGCLAAICALIERHGKRLLTTPTEGVLLATSKSRTLKSLAQHGVPIVPTLVLENPGFKAEWDYPWVFKIDDGVGCEDTFIIQGPYEQRMFDEKEDSRTWVAQPLLEGEALSLSGIFYQGEGRLLCCNRQNIRQTQEGFRLLGITVHARPDPEGIFKALLSRVARALPSLWGFAGIDFILGPEGPKVLEINPRLTSAYPGIRAATELNPAALVLALAQHHALPLLPEPLPGAPVELNWSLN